MQTFADKLTGCVGSLIDQGFTTIMLTPHIDNAVDSNQWRNWVRANPTQAVGGFSFWDIQVGPRRRAGWVFHPRLGALGPPIAVLLVPDAGSATGLVCGQRTPPPQRPQRLLHPAMLPTTLA